MDKLSVVCWKWGSLFDATYVNRLQSMLARHLHLPHQLFCVTDDPAGINDTISCVPMPKEHQHTPRCRRRMWQFARERQKEFGSRMLCIDLDVIVVDDLTPLVRRLEPLVMWRVGYANVYSGSFLLLNVGELHDAWVAYQRDPLGYPQQVQPRGIPSDQAMLNYHLRGKQVPCWTEKDGLITFFGNGYSKHEHHGISLNKPQLPVGSRIVILGSADKNVMDNAKLPWIKDHWR